MNRFFKTAILSAAVAATTLATLPAANAGDRHWRRHHSRTIIREATISRSPGFSGLPPAPLRSASLRKPAYREPVYVDRYRRPYREYPAAYDERDVVYADDYGGSMEPWSPEWYEYCSNRYRSFSSRSGTFTGYDGQQHFCVAN